MKRTAIIFGSNGQDGIYLDKLLSSKNIKVLKVSRKLSDLNGDISDFFFVNKIIKELKPNFIFHLAAISSVSHDYIIDNNDAIIRGTINILESLNKNKINCKTFFSGSAIQFVNNDLPINENSEFIYNNPYTIARNSAVNFIRYYRKKFGFKIYVGYLFN